MPKDSRKRILPHWDDLRGKIWWEIFKSVGLAMIAIIAEWIRGASRMEIGCTAIGVIIIFYLVVFLIRAKKAQQKQAPSQKENATPVTIEAIPIEDRSGADVQYSCQIRVKNIPLDSRESVDVNLTVWSPAPANPIVIGETSGRPMPTGFPILLMGRESGAKGHPNEVICELFRLVRAGSEHTIEIIGKQTKYAYFRPNSTWQMVSVQVESNTGVFGKQDFNLKLSRDPKGIPFFEIAKVVQS